MVETVLRENTPTLSFESKQQTLSGEQKELWYCIHCNYVGYEYKTKIAEGNLLSFELCPKCEWVCYSDTENFRLVSDSPCANE